MSKGKGKNNPTNPKTTSHNPQQQKPTGQPGQFQGQKQGHHQDQFGQFQGQSASTPSSSYGSTSGNVNRQHPGNQRTSNFNPNNPTQKPAGENRPHHGNPNKQGQPSNQQFKK